MKRIKSEKEQYRHKRAMRFIRRVQALVLAGAILVTGGFVVHAATVADVIDTQYYADKYPDLKAAFGYDSKALLQHYLTYGIAEGRDAGGLLDVREYRDAYADLDAAFGDDWNAYVNHFLTYGVFEGRNSGTDFNALDYAERYGDLKEAFGNNVLQLYHHYQTYGKNENREARSETVVVEEKRAAAAAAASAAAAAALEERRKLYPVLTDENGNIPDLGGMEIIVRDWWHSADGSDAYNEYETYLRDYQEWAMWRYNFTIKQIGMDEWDSYPQSLVAYVDKGGDDANYVFVLVNSGELLNAERQGYAYDLSTLDCLKFGEEKWVSGVHKYHSEGSSIYAMNFKLPEPRMAMFFNKSVLRDAGIDPDDIYKWQESGEWTWEKFEEVCKKITRDDVYALNGVSSFLYENAVYSNNGEFVGMENGKYVNGLAASRTQDALKWAMHMWDNYAYPEPEEYNEETGEYETVDLPWDHGVIEWCQGKGAFLAWDIGAVVARMSEPDAFSKDDLGMVCMPKGPAASDYTNIYSDNAYVIPSCYDAEKAWNIAFALNAWTMPISGYNEEEAVLNSYYYAFGDTKPVDLTIKRLLSNGRVTYHNKIEYFDTGLGEDLFWRLPWDDELIESNYAETIEKWNAVIAQANSGL